jgi:HPt (histidine-containing phosphotransfer) domain-containing protein
MHVVLTPPARTGPAIDPEHLRRVTFGDRAFRDEILALFLRDSKALLDRLAAAQTDSDWRLAAHSLKGMARGIGAFPLAEAAAQAEPLANGLRLEQRRAELAHIGRHLAEAAADAETMRSAPA